MVGLVVTPTTLYSSTSDCRLPLRMRSRDRSSSQTATPAFDSCARFSFCAMSGLSLRVGRPRCRGPPRACEWWAAPGSLRSGGGQRGPFTGSAVAGGVGQPAAGHPGTRGGRGTRGGGVDALAGGGHDGVVREPELLVEHGVGRAGAV